MLVIRPPHFVLPKSSMSAHSKKQRTCTFEDQPIYLESLWAAVITSVKIERKSHCCCEATVTSCSAPFPPCVMFWRTWLTSECPSKKENNFPIINTFQKTESGTLTESTIVITGRTNRWPACFPGKSPRGIQKIKRITGCQTIKRFTPIWLGN